MFATGFIIGFNENLHLFLKKLQIILKKVHRVSLNDVIGYSKILVSTLNVELL